MIFGRNIIKPVINAAMAAINTEAAARSFIIPALLSFSGLIRSASFSMDVLIISVMNTGLSTHLP